MSQDFVLTGNLYAKRAFLLFQNEISVLRLSKKTIDSPVTGYFIDLPKERRGSRTIGCEPCSIARLREFVT